MSLGFKRLNTGWECKRCKYLEVTFNQQMSKLQYRLNYRHSSTASQRQAGLGSAHHQEYESVTIKMLYSVGAQTGQKLTLTYSFLGSFAKMQKATISCVVSVSLCPSVRPSVWNNSAPNRRIFMKFDISLFFEILSRKFNFH